MQAATDVTRPGTTSEERAHLTFWTFGATGAASEDGYFSGDGAPAGVPVTERVRKIPEALLLTAGYYASRLPVVSDLIRRLD